LGIECETKFKNLHDEIERINEEIKDLKSEIKKNKTQNRPIKIGKKIATKIKRE
jgi:hypothetical protein